MSERTDEDMEALAHAFYDNLEYDPSCEYGSIGLDPKRPFGNSDVEADILEIIGMEPAGDDWTPEQREYAEDLYKNKLIPYLQEKWKEFQ